MPIDTKVEVILGLADGTKITRIANLEDVTTFLEQHEEYVKVVRCKDCKYWDNHDGGERCLNSIYLSWAKPENFCNYGERKDEVNNG